MARREFKTAAVIGTGMMGPGIALSLALGGVKTTILSRSAAGASSGLERAQQQLRVLEQNQLAGAQTARAVVERLESSADFDKAISAADLVIESAIEDMTFKQELFARMDAIAKPEAVLASNTSGLSITEVAKQCKRPERVLTTHFWNPPYVMKLVEVVRGKKTAGEVVSAVMGLLKKCGKAAVLVKKDRPGQLGNRMQLALLREAVHIVGEGIASVEDVDLAVKAGFGQRLPVYGVFEHADAVGLDMVLSIMDYISRDLYNEPSAPDALRNLVRRKHLGAKTGHGFYDWSQKDVEAVKARRDKFLLEFMKSDFAKQ